MIKISKLWQVGVYIRVKNHNVREGPELIIASRHEVPSFVLGNIYLTFKKANIPYGFRKLGL